MQTLENSESLENFLDGDFIKTLSPKICIGTKKGKGFFYFGNNDKKKIQDALNRAMSKRQTRLDSQKAKDVFECNLRAIQYMPWPSPDRPDYEEMMKQLVFSSYEVWRGAKYMVEDIENPYRFDLMKRKVCSVEQRSDGYIAIIIQGDEHGKYYFEEEYLQGLINDELLAKKKEQDKIKEREKKRELYRKKREERKQRRLKNNVY